jgi:hypothetical protein
MTTVAMDPRIIYAPPSLADIESDTLPDPEGYFAGQEEYGYDPKGTCSRDNDYDDAYEPDFQYDPY